MTRNEALLPKASQGGAEQYVKSKSAIASAAATLAASVLGTGVLAMPHACATGGLVLFLSLNAVALGASYVSAGFLARTAAWLEEEEEKRKLDQISSSSTSREHDGAELTLPSVARSVFGRTGDLFTSSAIVLQQVCSCAAYVVVVGDVFGPLVEHWLHHDDDRKAFPVWAVQLMGIGIVVAPLALLTRDISSLRYTSVLAVVAISSFALVVIANGLFVVPLHPSQRRSELITPTQDHGDHNTLNELGHSDLQMSGPYWFPRNSGSLRAIPLVCFAYFLHFNVIPVLSSLRNQIGMDNHAASSPFREPLLPVSASTIHESTSNDNLSVESGGSSSVDRSSTATMNMGDDGGGTNSNSQFALPVMENAVAVRRALTMSGTVTVLTGITGYYTFVNYTDPDVLSNFATSGTYISGLMNVVRAFYGVGLLLAFPVVFWEVRSNVLHLALGRSNAHTNTQFYGATLGLLAVCYVFGSLITNLSTIFGFVGSTATPILAYIIPAAVYLRSGCANEYGDVRRARAFLVVGTLLIPFGLLVWGLDLVEYWKDDTEL